MTYAHLSPCLSPGSRSHYIKILAISQTFPGAADGSARILKKEREGVYARTGHIRLPFLFYCQFFCLPSVLPF